MSQNFDLRTHIRNPKNGRVDKVQPYRMHISKDGQIFERDGKFYFADGSECTEPNKHGVVAAKPAVILRKG